MKGQLNDKDGLHHPTENEGYFETHLIDDMILVQNYIYNNLKQEQSNAIIDGVNFNDREMFPSLDQSLGSNMKGRKNAGGRNIKEESLKSHTLQKESQYKRPVNEYFFQRPTFEISDKEKIWDSYLDNMYVTSSVL